MANKQRAAKPAQNDSPLPGTEGGASTGADAGTGPDAGIGTGTGTGPDAGAGTQGGTSTGADAGTGPDAGTSTEDGTGTGTGIEDAPPSVDGRVRVRLLCTNHLGQIGDIVTVPTGHVDALRSGGLADPHPAALEVGE
ncbi:hypothetical protein [Stenotrophomonas sp.]|uniref:hypothetical protein n=1 Tax=Stenotrophomonas sp. TaxID=69392 RepID=UPI0028B0445D|nr:hypothetical protein [Stenotrophomonas sp.]